PVTLPPGRARLATRPRLTGSSAMPNRIGIVVVAALAASAARALPGAAITLTRRRTSSAASSGSPIEAAFGPAELDPDVLAFDVAFFIQTSTIYAQMGCSRSRRLKAEKSDYRHRRLLRARRERPCPALPSSVTNWRRLRSGMGSQPAVPAYSR